MTRPVLKLKTPRTHTVSTQTTLHAQESTLVRMFGSAAVQRLQQAQSELNAVMTSHDSGLEPHTLQTPGTAPGGQPQEEVVEIRPPVDQPDAAYRS